MVLVLHCFIVPGVRQIPYFHALSEKRFFYTVASARWTEVSKTNGL